MIRFLTCSWLILTFCNLIPAQKVLQIEKFGKAKTKKLYIGESIFIQTKQNPDWFGATIEDLRPDAQAIVFYDRIIKIDDITAMKFRKKSAMHGAGKAVQWSWIIPVAYQGIYDLVNPPDESRDVGREWKATGIIAGSAVLLGSLMRLIPPKKIKFGEKARRRLRVLDLTFYPKDNLTKN